MAMNLCADIGHISLCKHNEQLCGDHVEIVNGDDGSVTVVLADGLGSGVKASILSTLTSKLLSSMLSNGLSVRDCVQTMAATLPVCSERGIAYSTFTVIRLNNNSEAEIIQYDNPPVIMLRKGKNFNYPQITEIIDDKQISSSKIRLEENDVLIATSDGTLNASTGQLLNLNWTRKEIIEFMETIYDDSFTAKTLSSMLSDQCFALYGGEPGDDTTVCTVKVRKRNPVNVLIGPPRDPKDVNMMLSLFFSKVGKRVVCGGTTSEIVANYLGSTIDTSIPPIPDSDIPPISAIVGVDLVTEGVITLGRVLEYAKDYENENKLYTEWNYKKDGASLLARLLFEEATDINMYVGTAVNPAHQKPGLSVNFNVKMTIVAELAECMKKLGKNVVVSYF